MLSNFDNDAVKMAIQYFYEELKKSSVAKDYLKSRGISKETIVQFQLGYCPSNPIRWANRYHDRIIFPIWNQQNELVGWTGRTLVNDPAKYLNIKESDIFKKSRLLYAYNFAKETIFKKGAAILVEGQMDAILLHQAGIINTVASSGTTSFKEDAAGLLVRYAERVYIAFDGDKPGQDAAQTAKMFLNGAGVMTTPIVVFPKDHDPASYIQSFGKQEFLRILRESRQTKETART